MTEEQLQSNYGRYVQGAQEDGMIPLSFVEWRQWFEATFDIRPLPLETTSPSTAPAAGPSSGVAP